MIISKENLIEYILNSDSYLEEITSKETIKKLRTYETRIHQPPLSIVDNLFLDHQDSNKSLRKLAKEIGIYPKTLTRIFYYYNLPTKTKAEAVREELYERWKDPEFRERHAEAVRTARLDPANLSRYKLPTLQGFRRDISFEAQSAWEANLARIFQYLTREYHPHEKFDLGVPKEYKYLFNTDKTSVQVDFIVRNTIGKWVLYEIMASHLEEEKDWAKLEILVEQYNLPLRIISPKKYKRLERYFKERTQNSSAFCGWETSNDNILTNPEKYS